MKETYIRIAIYIAMGIATIVIINKLFVKPEQVLQKRFGKYFSRNYFISQLKDLYKDEISAWKEKGYTEGEILGYITSKYFDRPKFSEMAADIYNAKGIFSDDEERANSVIREVRNLGELSYLATVFKTNTAEAQNVLNQNPLISGNIFDLFSATSPEKSSGDDMLSYLIGFFNDRQLNVLISTLKKKPRKMVFKAILSPTGFRDSGTSTTKPKSAKSAGKVAGKRS